MSDIDTWIGRPKKHPDTLKNGKSISEMLDHLQEGVVEFVYVKNDEKEVIIKGTLEANILNDVLWSGVLPSMNMSPDDSVTIWSTNHAGWCNLKYESIKDYTSLYTLREKDVCIAKTDDSAVVHSLSLSKLQMRNLSSWLQNHVCDKANHVSNFRLNFETCPTTGMVTRVIEVNTNQELEM